MGRTREVALNADGVQGARRIELYSGPDLEQAASRSVEAAAALRRALSSAGHVSVRAPALRDLMNARWADWLPASTVVTGTERVSGETMRVWFRGRLRAVDFVATHIFGTDGFERGPADAHTGADVLVLDHPLLERVLPDARTGMAVPAWLRQTRGLGASWPETLRSFPASLRKELSRLLRRDAYTARIETAEPAKRAYYESLYVPYLTRRFGPSAVVRGPRAFAREAQGAALLELRADGALLGGALLRREAGGGLAIVNSALSLDNDRPGQSDLLDYFAFVTAQLLECRFVDFGVSRPHLDDGVLRYKAKWRSQIAPVGGPSKWLRIVPLRASPATLGFLSRNGFIERHGDRFVVRRLCADGHRDSAEHEQLVSLAARVGVDAVTLAPESALVKSYDAPTPSTGAPNEHSHRPHSPGAHEHGLDLHVTEPNAEPVAAFVARK